MPDITTPHHDKPFIHSMNFTGHLLCAWHATGTGIGLRDEQMVVPGIKVLTH